MSDFQLRVVVVALSVVTLLLVLVVVAMLRQIGRILLRLGDDSTELMPQGGPDFDEQVALPGTKLDRGVLVMFVSSSCAACAGITMALPEIRATLPELNLVLAVVDEDPAARHDYAQKLGVGARDDLFHLVKEWKIPGTPYAALRR